MFGYFLWRCFDSGERDMVVTGAYGLVEAVELLGFLDGQEHARFFDGELDPLLKALTHFFLRKCANRTEFFRSPWRLFLLEHDCLILRSHLIDHEGTLTARSSLLLFLLDNFVMGNRDRCKQFIETFR